MKVSGTVTNVISVSLNKTATTLTVGKTETLTATVAPANATNKAVAWTSSNTNVATVSATGTITAKTVGTTIITAKTVDGSKTAICSVTVVPGAVTGIDDQQTVEAMIWPNPNNGKFTLNLEKHGSYDVSITNLVGKVIFRKTLPGSRNEIDISSYPTGLYLVMISYEKRKTTVKTVKQ